MLVFGLAPDTGKSALAEMAAAGTRILPRLPENLSGVIQD